MKFLGKYNISKDAVLPIVAHDTGAYIFVDKGGEYDGQKISVREGENIVIPSRILEQNLITFKLKRRVKGLPYLRIANDVEFGILGEKLVAETVQRQDDVSITKYTVSENQNGFIEKSINHVIWVQNIPSLVWNIDHELGQAVTKYIRNGSKRLEYYHFFQDLEESFNNTKVIFTLPTSGLIRIDFT